MATESQAIPKLQEFRFLLKINGIPEAVVQHVDPGDRKHGIMKIYGGGMNHSHKEVGMIEFEDCVVGKVIPISGAGGKEIEQWANKAQDPELNRGQGDYYQMISLDELDNEFNLVRGWDFYNCQVSVFKLGKREAGSLDKPVIEEVHIAYDYRKQR